MGLLRVLGSLAGVVGGLTSSCGYLKLSATSIPYQDAPEELLIAQDSSIASYESVVQVGLVVLFIGLLLLVLPKWVGRK